MCIRRAAQPPGICQTAPNGRPSRPTGVILHPGGSADRLVEYFTQRAAQPTSVVCTVAGAEGLTDEMKKRLRWGEDLPFKAPPPARPPSLDQPREAGQEHTTTAQTSSVVVQDGGCSRHPALQKKG